MTATEWRVKMDMTDIRQHLAEANRQDEESGLVKLPAYLEVTPIVEIPE
jgi:hypothetical protein